MARRIETPEQIAERQAQGIAIRQWREAKGWTRADAAHFLGVSVTAIKRWEEGYAGPGDQALQLMMSFGYQPPVRACA